MPSTLDNVGAFTTNLRTEFMSAMAARRPVTPAPWEAFTTKVTSTGRAENHGWMSPPPRLAPWIGSRRYANVDISKYELENRSYDASFFVPTDDIKDIQLADGAGGYRLHAQAMADDALEFPGREVIRKLSVGATDLGFDGTAFFADAHTIGTGDNLMTADNAGNDGVTHKIIALYHGSPFKPALWQEREIGGLNDDAGTKESEKEKKVHFWVDLRGAAGYGFWWDAILMTITDTPTLAELDAILGSMLARFRSFYLEKADAGDDAMYMHEQTVFGTSNLTFLVNPLLGDMMGRLMTVDTVTLGSTPTTNFRKGLANVIVTSRLGS
jgi:phage major head subunit gpT-like protein